MANFVVNMLSLMAKAMEKTGKGNNIGKYVFIGGKGKHC